MTYDDAAMAHRPAGDRPRILIENSEYWLRNNGDLAMLQVTVDRLRARWPRARIAVLTDSPELLRSFLPDCEAVTVGDAAPWSPAPLGERLAARLGAPAVGPVAIAWLRVAAWWRVRPAGASRRLRRAWRALRGDPTPVPDPEPFVGENRGSFAAVEASSLLLALGGGYLTDADPDQTRRVLSLVDHAALHRVPVVMVGQGIGPLTDPQLRSRAGDALPRVSVIALRERRRGPELLDQLGVPADRVLVTGDDAIELAWEQRRPELGHDIGLCLRGVSYSPASAQALDSVGQAVRGVAEEVGAHIAPLFVAEYRSQDRSATLPQVRGFSQVRGLQSRYCGPRRLAERVSRCRVMVTSAYHLAVFALSQGIPVVGLTSSTYYDDKLHGLADMFGAGLRVVDLSTDDLSGAVATALRASWDEAAEVREPLRAAAVDQIQRSRAGYERVFALLENPAPTR